MEVLKLKSIPGLFGASTKSLLCTQVLVEGIKHLLVTLVLNVLVFLVLEKLKPQGFENSGVTFLSSIASLRRFYWGWL